MKRNLSAVGLATLLMCAAPVTAGAPECPPDSVKVGNVCIDLYEASVWQIPPSSTSLVKQVQAGEATAATLTAGGATQLSPASSCSPAYPANFPATGQWTPVLGSSPPSPGVYAVSIPGVHPSACITWFQAAQACRLSGKRLLTGLEWQDAAAGTPDPGTDNGTTDCNISVVGDAADTGSRSDCKSNWGVFDMVGNVDEWVADSDFGGDDSPKIPGTLFRGGLWGVGALAGVFVVSADGVPSNSGDVIGFRCAR